MSRVMARHLSPNVGQADRQRYDPGHGHREDHVQRLARLLGVTEMILEPRGVFGSSESQGTLFVGVFCRVTLRMRKSIGSIS